MIGILERVLFGPPSPRPLAGWVCANEECRRPLDTAESVHRFGSSLLICGDCQGQLEADRKSRPTATHEEFTEDELARISAEAEALVGKRIRDSLGREWTVEGTDWKDGWPTIHGKQYWDRPEAVTVLS